MLLILCIIFIINGYINKDEYEKILRKKKKKLQYKNKTNIDNKFYELDVYPELKQIKLHKDKIRTEVKKSLENNLEEWTDWPEKNLYNGDNVWKIMPFYYYGTWVNKNCEKMPELTKFLHKLPTLRIALLSILAPNTVLKEHKGWGSHSNNVLRCHYGILVPHNCYIGVKNEGELKISMCVLFKMIVKDGCMSSIIRKYIIMIIDNPEFNEDYSENSRYILIVYGIDRIGTMGIQLRVLETFKSSI